MTEHSAEVFANPPSAEALLERGLARVAAATPGWEVFKAQGSLTGVFEVYDAPIEGLSMTREAAIRSAMADFTAAIERNPERGDAWLARARLRRALGHPDAWTDYEQAAQLFPQDATIRIERAGHKLNSKNPAGALADAEAATLIAPGNPDAWAARGWVRLAKQDAGARADFGKALELNPDHLPSLVGRARACRGDDPAGARRDIERAISIAPARGEDSYFRGLAIEAIGDAAKAREEFTRALESTPVWSPRRPELEWRLRKSDKVPFHKAALAAPVTSVLLGACIVVFLAAERVGSTQRTDILLRFGANNRALVWAGEYWRLFTAMFLHIGWIHLVWNLWAMFGVCGMVERSLGHARFLATYLATGIAASALSLVGHAAVGAGASGAGFGMIGMLLGGALVKLGGVSAFMTHRGTRSVLKWTGAWFVLGLTALRFDNWAHFGGLLAGLLMGGLWTGGRYLHPAARGAAWAAFAIAFVALVAAAVRPWPFLYR